MSSNNSEKYIQQALIFGIEQTASKLEQPVSKILISFLRHNLGNLKFIKKLRQLIIQSADRSGSKIASREFGIHESLVKKMKDYNANRKKHQDEVIQDKYKIKNIDFENVNPLQIDPRKKRKCQQFSDKQKVQLVKQFKDLKSQGMKLADVEEQLNVHPNNLRLWQRQVEEGKIIDKWDIIKQKQSSLPPPPIQESSFYKKEEEQEEMNLQLQIFKQEHNDEFNEIEQEMNELAKQEEQIEDIIENLKDQQSEEFQIVPIKQEMDLDLDLGDLNYLYEEKTTQILNVADFIDILGNDMFQQLQQPKMNWLKCKMEDQYQQEEEAYEFPALLDQNDLEQLSSQENIENDDFNVEQMLS